MRVYFAQNRDYRNDKIITKNSVKITEGKPKPVFPLINFFAAFLFDYKKAGYVQAMAIMG